MKSIFFLLLPFLVGAQITTGSLLYPKGSWDFQKNETVSLRYNGGSVVATVDNITPDLIKSLLNKAGVKTENFLEVRAYGSSVTDEIEVFFAYKDAKPPYSLDLILGTNHHDYYAVAYGNGIFIPWYAHIGYKADSLANALARLAPIRTFRVRPYAATGLPFTVLGYGVSGGGLADMRNIPKSYKLVPFFKDLGWSIIWYQDSLGVERAINKPYVKAKGKQKASYHTLKLDSTDKADVIKAGPINTYPIKKHGSELPAYVTTRMPYTEDQLTGIDGDPGISPVSTKAAPVKMTQQQLERYVAMIEARLRIVEDAQPGCCCDAITHYKCLYLNYYDDYINRIDDIYVNDRLPLDNICPGATGILILSDATLFYTWVGYTGGNNGWQFNCATHGGMDY